MDGRFEPKGNCPVPSFKARSPQDNCPVQSPLRFPTPSTPPPPENWRGKRKLGLRVAPNPYRIAHGLMRNPVPPTLPRPPKLGGGAEGSHSNRPLLRETPGIGNRPVWTYCLTGNPLTTFRRFLVGQARIRKVRSYEEREPDHIICSRGYPRSGENSPVVAEFEDYRMPQPRDETKSLGAIFPLAYGFPVSHVLTPCKELADCRICLASLSPREPVDVPNASPVGWERYQKK